tara:strand:+ start:1091 stop:1258 length:168 start_codon:yes stop_codon:yes gene_type:complete
MYLELGIKLNKHRKVISVMQKKDLNKTLFVLGVPLWVIAIMLIVLCVIINDLWFI